MRDLRITGLGPVSPIGVGMDELEAAFRGRESAVARVTDIELPEALAAGGPLMAARLESFDLADHLDSAKTYLDDVSRYLLAACAIAKEDGALEVTDENKLRVGVCCGAAYGPLTSAATFNERVRAKGARLANPLIFGHTYINTAASLVAIEWGLMGFNCIISSGLTSGAAAICQGADALQIGHADALFCGGSDAAGVPLLVGLAAEGRARRGDGQGIAPADGGGVVLLETAETAERRGAETRGRLLGAATATDSRLHKSLADAASLALADAEIAATEVDLVVRCANGSPDIDEADSRACESTFAGVPTIAPKELTGETFAAAAGIDTALALLSLEPGQTGVILSLDWRGAAAALIVRK